MSLIHLIGPGGAGKSTAGILLAERLNCPLLDLDRHFNELTGDISDFLNQYGYDAYVQRNVEVYLLAPKEGVLALSSGFMTYDNVHPHYHEIRETIAQSSTTFVLLPSLDLEGCVRETVKRQLNRHFRLNAVNEERKIRQRFPVYAELPARKIGTMQSPESIADQILHTLCQH